MFGKFDLEKNIENAAVCVVAKDDADEVVGFLSVYVQGPRLSSLPGVEPPSLPSAHVPSHVASRRGRVWGFVSPDECLKDDDDDDE